MKPSIKKLRTCLYSRDLVAIGFFGQADQHSNKLVCDHPEMKINWTEKVCGPCQVYVNRNASIEIRSAAAPQPATPERPAAGPPAVPVAPQNLLPSPATPIQAEPPVQTTRPVAEPESPVRPTPVVAPASPAAQPEAKPARSASKTKAPAQEAKKAAIPKAKVTAAKAKPEPAKGKPKKTTTKMESKRKQK
ncbi:MAG TPA: hypothetical protein VHP35_03095 [Terriglobia bacterium]|nr:hypothetical protein [Terriglobia bacterium]